VISTVFDEFEKKHPTLSPINYDALISPEFPLSETCHQVIFEEFLSVIPASELQGLLAHLVVHVYLLPVCF